MARPIDQERHEQRRLVIMDAALTCFARAGIERATTAEICREAGIGSGTFFHYFPTKLDVLRAILELGSQETSDWFDSRDRQDADPLVLILDHVDHVAEEAREPRLAGFVAAVSTAMHTPEIAAALENEQQIIRDGLRPWVARAREEDAIRRDWSIEQTVAWIMALEDAFTTAVAMTPAFDAAAEAAVLRDIVQRALLP